MQTIARKGPENKNCVNTPEDLPAEGQDRQIRSQGYLLLLKEQFKVGVGKREVKFMAINELLICRGIVFLRHQLSSELNIQSSDYE